MSTRTDKLDLAQFEGHTPGLRIDHFFQLAARSVNARFQPAIIERHEARWIQAAYKRHGLNEYRRGMDERCGNGAGPRRARPT